MSLNQKIIKCTKCLRLITYCKKIAIEKRNSYEDWDYWGKPVANFGSFPCKLLVVGLAPAAHGANRTGRIFTGDNSGLWLYRALFRVGFASQEKSESKNDSLNLIDACITCVAHCAPPQNKLTRSEILNCSGFLRESLEASQAQVIVALGRVAWDACLKEFKTKNTELKKPAFKHGQICKVREQSIIASYHPSQQNTFTKKLTEKMFDEIFFRVRILLDESS